MILVDMEVAKHQLSRLIDRALAGECVVIARDGKPVARLMQEATPLSRLGFMCGEMRVPKDFDQMGSTEIQAMFGVTASPPGPIRTI